MKGFDFSYKEGRAYTTFNRKFAVEGLRSDTPANLLYLKLRAIVSENNGYFRKEDFTSLCEDLSMKYRYFQSLLTLLIKKGYVHYSVKHKVYHVKSMAFTYHKALNLPFPPKRRENGTVRKKRNKMPRNTRNKVTVERKSFIGIDLKGFKALILSAETCAKLKHWEKHKESRDAKITKLFKGKKVFRYYTDHKDKCRGREEVKREDLEKFHHLDATVLPHYCVQSTKHLPSIARRVRLQDKDAKKFVDRGYTDGYVPNAFMGCWVKKSKSTAWRWSKRAATLFPSNFSVMQEMVICGEATSGKFDEQFNRSEIERVFGDIPQAFYGSFQTMSVKTIRSLKKKTDTHSLNFLDGKFGQDILSSKTKVELVRVLVLPQRVTVRNYFFNPELSKIKTKRVKIVFGSQYRSAKRRNLRVGQKNEVKSFVEVEK